MTQPPKPQAKRRRKGFEQAAAILGAPIRRVAEGRGFAVARLLTHWPELVGAELASRAHPLRVTHNARDGFGATLVLLCPGAAAPLIQMQASLIREKVNACYGYNAIARIRITQTAPTGFAEGQLAFVAKPARAPAPDAETRARAEALVGDCRDAGLRAALARLTALRLARQDHDFQRKVTT
ncbi:MAG: DciA family protein [Paracoccus sp. (in: a-proteobacteria)]|nr:DciA family protein [Paracoccus sp. (in: a-proteobacteria)]